MSIPSFFVLSASLNLALLNSFFEILRNMVVPARSPVLSCHLNQCRLNVKRYLVVLQYIVVICPHHLLQHDGCCLVIVDSHIILQLDDVFLNRVEPFIQLSRILYICFLHSNNLFICLLRNHTVLSPLFEFSNSPFSQSADSLCKSPENRNTSSKCNNHCPRIAHKLLHINHQPLWQANQLYSEVFLPCSIAFRHVPSVRKLSWLHS